MPAWGQVSQRGVWHMVESKQIENYAKGFVWETGSWYQPWLPDDKIWSLSFLGLRQGGGHGGAVQKKEGIKFRSVAQRSHSPEAQRAKHIQAKNLATAIWQPCLFLRHCREERKRALSGRCNAAAAATAHPLLPSSLISFIFCAGVCLCAEKAS